jgi:hypothetical protein
LFIQSTYAQWATLNGLSGASGDPTADADIDGLTNLHEWFFNLNPNVPLTAAERAALPVIGYEPATGTIQYLTLTFRRNFRAAITSIEYQAGASPDAASWSPIVPNIIERISYDAVTGDPILRAKFAVAPADIKMFLRIKLTQ